MQRPSRRAGVARARRWAPTWYDAGSTLAFVAGVTTRIRLLSHVLVLPYRHPLVVAKQYGTLDHLSGGRVILGVGSGHLKPEFKVLGADYEGRGKVDRRVPAAIAAAWEHDVAAYDGETVVVPRRHGVAAAGTAAAAAVLGRRQLEAPASGARRASATAGFPGSSRPRSSRAADACACASAPRRGRIDPFELVAPLGVAGRRGRRRDGRREATRWRAAGATAFHVGIAAESWTQYLDRLAWFGRDVIARV